MSKDKRNDNVTTNEQGERILRIMCPSLACRRVLAVPETARGRMVKCKGCGTTVRVPVKVEKPDPKRDGADATGEKPGETGHQQAA